MNSADRLLAVLSLFNEARPFWTVEEAAASLNVSVSTAYRYFRSLCKAGLLDPVIGNGYRLGPGIIEYDRLIQLTDPMIAVARPILDKLQADGEGEVIAILCRLYRERVMCVLEAKGAEPLPNISYERGRPMPMFKGATSKIILAQFPSKTLKRLYDRHFSMIANSGLGNDWNEFREILKEIRRKGHHVSEGEIDPGRVGIAAPIFNKDKDVLGSVSVVCSSKTTNYASVNRLIGLTMAAAKNITASLGSDDGKLANTTTRVVA